MTTPITPLRSPAIADLRNALQLAVTYGSKDVADSDAKQALHRVQGLVARAIASLGEPNGAALAVVATMTPDRNAPFHMQAREIRDFAAAVLHAAVTGEVGGEGWIDTLPCPTCTGSGMIGLSPCEDCKATGRVR
jgi:hypothetical protein